VKTFLPTEILTNQRTTKERKSQTKKKTYNKAPHFYWLKEVALQLLLPQPSVVRNKITKIVWKTNFGTFTKECCPFAKRRHKYIPVDFVRGKVMGK
jgi:hypothetical protein